MTPPEWDSQGGHGGARCPLWSDAAPWSARGAGVCLILAPDDEDADALQQLLQGNGVRTRRQPSIQKALAYLGTTPVAAVFCLEQVADGTALDFLDALPRDEPAPRVVIVAGFDRSRFAAEAMSRGAFDFLPLPLDPAEVSSCAMRATTGQVGFPEGDQVLFDSREGFLTLLLPAQMDFEASHNLGKILEGELPIPRRGVLVDMTRTRSIASSGVGSFFLIHKKFAIDGGRPVVFVAASPSVRNILALAGLDQIAHVEPTMEAGLDALRARS